MDAFEYAGFAAAVRTIKNIDAWRGQQRRRLEIANGSEIDASQRHELAGEEGRCIHCLKRNQPWMLRIRTASEHTKADYLTLVAALFSSSENYRRIGMTT